MGIMPQYVILISVSVECVPPLAEVLWRLQADSWLPDAERDAVGVR